MLKDVIGSAVLARLVRYRRRQSAVVVGALVAVVAVALAFGVSERSASAQSEPETVGRVTGLAASVEGQPPGTVHLTWNAAENAQVHFVYYIDEEELNARNWSAGQMRAFNGTEATIDGLAGGHTYYFAARGMGWDFGKFEAVWGEWVYWETATPALATAPEAVPTSCAEQHPARPYLCEPILPPENMAQIHWGYNLDLYEFREWVIDFTIHNDVGDFSDQHGLDLNLGTVTISKVGLSFGLQTDARSADSERRYGKTALFSRYGTSDLTNARFDDENGWAEAGSSEHSYEFIGARRSYDWGAGDYPYPHCRGWAGRRRGMVRPCG